MSRSLQHSLPTLAHIHRRFHGHMTGQKGPAAVAILTLLAGVALRLLEPFPLKLIFDRVVQVRKSTRGIDWSFIDDMEPQRLLLLVCGATVAIVGLRAVADYFNRVIFAKIGNTVLTRVRGEIFRHLHHLSLSFHTSARTGDLTVRVISDVNMMRDVMVTAVLPLLANTLVFVGMWAVMFWLNWQLAVLGLAAFPLMVLWTSFLSVRIRDAARKQRRKEGAMASTATEAISSMRVVQAFGLESVFNDAFGARSDQSRDQDVRTAKLSARLERAVDVMLALGTALVLWMGSRLVIQGEMTAGDLLIFLMYLRRAFNPVQDFVKYSGRLAKAAAAGERLVDILDSVPEVRDLPNAQPAPPFSGSIVLRDVVFAYPAGDATPQSELSVQDTAPLSAGGETSSRRVLDRLSLEIPAGTSAAIVGPSGIGKSTIASLILRLYDPQQGQIAIDARDIRGFTLSTLRAQIAVVLQESLLFAVSIRDNIAYGRQDATEQEIVAAATLARAHEFIQELPQGYQTVVGERGVTLSGGQRQRIAIARAAIRNAPILLLDEPTTGLDEENQRGVIEAIQHAGMGRTTLLITHDLTLASRADRIFYLDAGRVAESGSHRDLIALNGRYAALHRLQTMGLEIPTASRATVPV